MTAVTKHKIFGLESLKHECRQQSHLGCVWVVIWVASAYELNFAVASLTDSQFFVCACLDYNSHAFFGLFAQDRLQRGHHENAAQAK